jgi:hypothetical protein
MFYVPVSRAQTETETPCALTSTWALSHLSILSDLTFEICVPSLRWRAAHRMQRKIPNCSAR